MTFSNWKEYQAATADVFRRLQCDVKIEYAAKGPHATHDVDVYATFHRSGILCTWIVECKLWNKPVDKGEVMKLRGIVTDLGADRGILISEAGFQSGAQDAARGTNITLVSSLAEFERTALAATSETPLVLEKSGGDDLPIFRFPFPAGPHDLIVHGDTIVSANWSGCSICIINPETKSILRTIDLDKYESKSPLTGQREIRGYSPGSLVIADGRLFLGQVFSDFILVIDLATHAIVRRIPVPGGGEGELAVSPDEKQVYFASNRLNQFYIIDSATYDFIAVPYPSGGRGCLSLLRHPDKELLYIGISRGGRINGRAYPHANSYLAVYDLGRGEYIGDCQLAEVRNDMTDDACPVCIAYDRIDDRLYVGMFQSMRGIMAIDASAFRPLTEIRIARNSSGPEFPWSDPLSLALDDGDLLFVARNNNQLAILERHSLKLRRTVDLGHAPNGPASVAVWNRQAIVAYPGRNGLIFIPLDPSPASAATEPS
ncbi:hypothetical protein J2X04_001296 [Lysobacter niabensis]|uniref:Restriction endonuclease type IV Mrr domain-containing protein n=1 Tax=Agrilutibacter niabensis TaxID=380628 RepID=A0ABU1VN94_9GAMM|nr:restriction endonuclease [Lysobacter niabensis]MDR7098949.1 hypothetical protein [Lysobacter niabensis]